jgi:hypothetical protein
MVTPGGQGNPEVSTRTCLKPRLGGIQSKELLFKLGRVQRIAGIEERRGYKGSEGMAGKIRHMMMSREWPKL